MEKRPPNRYARNFEWARKRPTNLIEWFRKTFAYLDSCSLMAEWSEKVCKEEMAAELEKGTDAAFEKAKRLARTADNYHSQMVAYQAKKSAMRKRFNERILSRYFAPEYARIIGIYLFETAHRGMLIQKSGSTKKAVENAVRQWRDLMRFMSLRQKPDPDRSVDPSEPAFEGRPDRGLIGDYTSRDGAFGIVFTDRGQYPGLPPIGEPEGGSENEKAPD